jgi:hypothetical protein
MDRPPAPPVRRRGCRRATMTDTSVVGAGFWRQCGDHRTDNQRVDGSGDAVRVCRETAPLTPWVALARDLLAPVGWRWLPLVDAGPVAAHDPCARATDRRAYAADSVAVGLPRAFGAGPRRGRWAAWQGEWFAAVAAGPPPAPQGRGPGRLGRSSDNGADTGARPYGDDDARALDQPALRFRSVMSSTFPAQIGFPFQRLGCVCLSTFGVGLWIVCWWAGGEVQT